MAQHDNEHLTSTQISAYIDNELTPDELAFCQSHLPTCQSCQNLLADLQYTAALLHRLPPVEVPRSFVLPANIALVAKSPARAPLPLHRKEQPALWKRSLRAVSALAAVLGVLLFLAGGLSSLSFGAGSSANTASSSVEQSAGNAPAVATPGFGTISPSPSVERVQSSPTKQQHTSSVGGASPAPPPPVEAPPQLDPTLPEGRLGIGSLLLLLGILGLILTRRTHSPAPPS